MAMIEIGLNRVRKNFGFKNVLSGASLEIHTGERAALVGQEHHTEAHSRGGDPGQRCGQPAPGSKEGRAVADTAP